MGEYIRKGEGKMRKAIICAPSRVYFEHPRGKFSHSAMVDYFDKIGIGAIDMSFESLDYSDSSLRSVLYAASRRAKASDGSRHRFHSARREKSGSAHSTNKPTRPAAAQAKRASTRSAGMSDRRRLSTILNFASLSSFFPRRKGKSCQSPRVHRCVRRKNPRTVRGCPSKHCTSLIRRAPAVSPSSKSWLRIR